MTLISGLDVGEATEPSALVTLDMEPQPVPNRPGIMEHHYKAVGLHQFERGTAYEKQIEWLRPRFASPPLKDTVVGIDFTGVGRGVLALFRYAQIDAWFRPILITGGFTTTTDEETGAIHVPKRELGYALVAVMESGRLKLPTRHPLYETIETQIQTLRIKVKKDNGSETFSGKDEGNKDDMALALAMALWLGEHTPVSWDGKIGTAGTFETGRSWIEEAPRGVFGDSAGNPNSPTLIWEPPGGSW